MNGAWERPEKVAYLKPKLGHLLKWMVYNHRNYSPDNYFPKTDDEHSISWIRNKNANHLTGIEEARQIQIFCVTAISVTRLSLFLRLLHIRCFLIEHANRTLSFQCS